MKFTGVERQILYHLSQAEWVSVKDLARRVYDSQVPLRADRACIRTHIYNLRKKLPDTIDSKMYKGYRLKRDVPNTTFTSKPTLEPEPSKNPPRWTSDDHDILRDMYYAGWSDRVIAQRLGRSKGAVQVHRYEMGLRWKRGQKGKELCIG